MKSALLSTIFILVCLSIIAQDPPLAENNGTTNQIYIALRQLTELPVENLMPNSSNNITDKDRNSYNIVKIGNQFWMAENLKTTKFNDGTAIPLVSYYKAWSNLLSPGYCWYNDDPGSNKTNYGALYNGYTVSTGKLCPTGWHVPSDVEWTILTTFLGGETLAGGKLKEINNWMSPNTGATNETGFKALPGGSRGTLGSFMDERLRGHWWSSTEYDKTNIMNNTMAYSSSQVTGSSDNKKSGLAVRCIKN